MANAEYYLQANREKFVSFLNNGCKQTKRLGFELEHFLIDKNLKPASYRGDKGILELLEKLSEFYDSKIMDIENVVGLSRKNETVTLEPAGQLEISTGPFENIEDIEAAYAIFLAEINPILDDLNLRMLCEGYNRYAPAENLALIPKYRYKCMKEFLGNQSKSAVYMMRGTASLQISIDYSCEKDALRKLRIAEIISPILGLICDNSPYFEGKSMRNKHMARCNVWLNMKQDRVGIIPGSLSENFNFYDYADYVLTREAILVPDLSKPQGWDFVRTRTFDELYSNKLMTDTEIAHAISMIWPDVRLKNFVEIRPADSMPIEYSLAYAALIKGLFYSDESLASLEGLFEGVNERDIRFAKLALMEKGYDAIVFDKANMNQNRAAYYAKELSHIANQALSAKEKIAFEPLARLIDNEKTLASLNLPC